MASGRVLSHGSEDATLAVSGLAIALTVISTALRVYTRIFTRTGLGPDDWSILLAVAATLASAALLLRGNSVDPNGFWVSENTDPNYIYTPEDVFYIKLAYISSMIYFTITGATKLGILLMYYRIFAVSTVFRCQLFMAVAMVVGWWVGCTVATLTSCIPLERGWIDGLPDPRYCLNYNIFLDVLILTLPISVVIRMRMSPKRKLTVSLIFLLGGFTIITGLVKVILGFPVGSRVPSYSNTEVWAVLHAGLAIVCASLPIFRPLVKRISQSPFAAKISSLLSLRRFSSQPRVVYPGKLSERSSEQRASGSTTPQEGTELVHWVDVTTAVTQIAPMKEGSA
ncbi:hypothetical protein F4779DRAFT_621473 [Xylariaceae sp. FL0662B]|nr:hypothetical protein F4779DRAFT_621473 [Xylariaceae sp. FL0662B]